MAGSIVISMLSKKYAKLLGEFEFAERAVEDAIGLDAIIEATNRCDANKKEISEKLAAIETVIWLFDANWDPAAVRPNYPRRTVSNPGKMAKAAYAVLRDAKVPMTSREVARVVAVRLGYEKIEEAEMKRIDLDIYNVFTKRAGTTLMIASRSPIRWALIPRDQALPRAKERRPANLNAETEAPSLPAAGRRAS